METRDSPTEDAWTGVDGGVERAWAVPAIRPIPPGVSSVVGGGGRPELFGSVTPPARHRGFAWLCLHASLATHALVGAALVIVPILTPQAPPAALRAVFANVVFDPPPPPPPPLASRPSVPIPKPALAAVPDPRPDALLVPPDVIDSMPDTIGMPEGVEGGVEGGVVGGTLGGVVGGVIGGTGSGLVPEPQPDRPPSPLRLSKPRYPQEAFVKRIEGTVELEILIDTEGRVVDARVTKSIPLLDAAAIATVREWRFSPAVKDGRPVAALARAPVTFRIH